MYDRVPQDDNSSERGLLSKEEEHHLETPRSSRLSWLLQILTGVLVLGLITSNVILVVKNHNLSHRIKAEAGYTGINAIPRHPETFHTYSAYSSTNTSISDPLWSNFTTNGFVALPHIWASQQNLPPAQNFPDDPTKGIYVLDAFHNLHCIMYLRNVIAELRGGGNVDDRLVHIHHCYDALRQSVQCRADDTPLTTPYRSKLTGDGQVRMCRDWDALSRWADEKSACWPTGRCADLEQHINEG